MSGASFRDTLIESTKFNYSVLNGADFSSSDGRGTAFSYAHLAAANFSNATLLASNFLSARMQGAQLSGARLIAVEFDDAHLQGTDLSSTILTSASFQGAYLQDSDIDYANIKGASFVGASLRGASATCVLPFRVAFEQDNQNLKTDDSKSILSVDLSETVVSGSDVECIRVYTDSTDYFSALDQNIYDLESDRLPAVSSYDGTYGLGYVDTFPDTCDGCQDLTGRPEKLEPKAFESILEQFLSQLPDDDSKARVRSAFERLKPDARTRAQDEAEKAFWSDLAKNSASQESHDKALAARLEAIACVADGAPYVARGLLRAGRFDRLYQDKETNEKEQKRIFGRLRKASNGGDTSCLGAKGLVDLDFASTERISANAHSSPDR